MTPTPDIVKHLNRWSLLYQHITVMSRIDATCYIKRQCKTLQCMAQVRQTNMSPLAVLLVVLGAVAATTNGLAVKEITLRPSSASRARRDVRGRGGFLGAYPFATPPFGLNKTRVPDIVDHIVGGKDAVAKEFPHMASMQVVMPSDFFEPQHLCGGTLIHERWVLTAAHCAYGVPARTNRVEVVLGITSLSGASTSAYAQRIIVEKMLVHAVYDPVSNQGVGPFDIALLKLYTPAKLNDYVKLANLPSPNSIISTGTVTLSGWGSIVEDGNRPKYPDRLQRADFPVIAYQTCRDYVTKIAPGMFNPLEETNLCAGNLAFGHVSSCSGDSGGPLVTKQSTSNTATVVGIVSWGLADCGSIPFPSVFTRVSAFNDWIAAVQQQY